MPKARPVPREARGELAALILRGYPSREGPENRKGPVGRATGPFGRMSLDSADDDRQHVASGEHEVLLATELHLGAAVLGVEHLVTDGDVERNAVAVVVDAAGAHGDDLALLRLLLGGVRDDQTRRGDLLGFDLLDDDAILERLDGDRHV